MAFYQNPNTFLVEYLYSSADIVLSMIYILCLQTFEVFFGFVYSFAIYKL